MIAFGLYGITVLILMVGETVRGFDGGRFNHNHATWVYYFSIVLIFISNMILLHIFNNLVEQQLALANQEDAEDSESEVT